MQIITLTKTILGQAALKRWKGAMLEAPTWDREFMGKGIYSVSSGQFG